MTIPETDIDPRQLTFAQVLADKAKRLGDKNFLHNLADGRKWSYAELDRDTSRIAAGFIGAGIEPGCHVAVMMENCPEQLLAYFALGKLGAVTVPVNTAARGDLLVYFLKHADCAAAVVEQHLLTRLLEVLGSLPSLRRIFVLHEGGQAMPDFKGADVAVFDLAGLVQCEPVTLPATRYCDLAFLMYTSGTTGPSKATMFAQANVLYWGWDYALHYEYMPEDIAYVYLPLFHGNGWLCTTMGALMGDASVALARRFSASRFWHDVALSGATLTNCLGAVASFLWAQPPGPQDRNHRMRRVGVAPVPSFGAGFEQRFGVAIMSSFGLTDYCMATAYNARHPRAKLGSSGKSRRGVAVRIADEDDVPLPAGIPGEIVLRSDNPWGSALGYYKMPEASLASRRNLWFHTGDRGYLDTDGYLYYTDRIKDAIRRRGENISAFEVESVIASHPAVEAAAVYAVRSESTEDEVAASVVLKPGAALSAAELVAHCRKNLAYFMIPRYVEFVPGLPLTLSQKVEKYLLKKRAQESLQAMWDREKAGIVLER